MYHNFLIKFFEPRELLQMVGPLIQKEDTVLRRSITPHQRLASTLRFLATGRSYTCLRFSTGISTQCLSKIIPETCSAICTVLNNYIKVGKLNYPIIIFFDLTNKTINFSFSFYELILYQEKIKN